MSETIDERPGPAIYPADFGKGTKPVESTAIVKPKKEPVQPKTPTPVHKPDHEHS